MLNTNCVKIYNEEGKLVSQINSEGVIRVSNNKLNCNDDELIDKIADRVIEKLLSKVKKHNPNQHTESDIRLL